MDDRAGRLGGFGECYWTDWTSGTSETYETNGTDGTYGRRVWLEPKPWRGFANLTTPAGPAYTSSVTISISVVAPS